MRFAGKARYAGPFDRGRHSAARLSGDIGRQYNPIAIAQYGLARFNALGRTAATAADRSGVDRRGGLARARRCGPTATACASGCTTSTGRTGSGSRRRGIRGWRRATACRCSCARRRTTGEAQIRRRRASGVRVAAPRRRRGRRARDRRQRRRLDRGIPRRSAEPHPERLHLGAVGRLRLRALDAAVRTRFRSVDGVRRARSRGAWRSSTPAGGRSTRRATGPGNAREPLLPHAAHHAASRDAPADRDRRFRGLRRPLSDVSRSAVASRARVRAGRRSSSCVTTDHAPTCESSFSRTTSRRK